MKNRILYSVLIAFVAFLAGLSAYSQPRIEILNVNTDNYPEITAEIYVYDANNELIGTLTADQIKVLDKDSPRNVLDYKCFPPDKTRFSSCLTIDKSSSMDKGIDYPNPSTKREVVAKQACKKWIDELPLNCEAAITFFSDEVWTRMRLDWTTDKEALKDTIDLLDPQGSTDYNAAFLKPFHGSIPVCDNAKYKKIIIFLSDGNHALNKGPVKTTQIVSDARAIDATVYALVIGQPASDDLIDICQNTGGDYYDDITSQEELDKFFREIRKASIGQGYAPPCELTWEAECSDGEVRFEIDDLGISASATYSIPEDVKPVLECEPRYIDILNAPQAGETFEIKLTSRRNKSKIEGAILSDGSRFQVSDWGGAVPFELPQDESRTVKLTYTPNDSVCRGTSIAFTGTACYDTIAYANAGMIYVVPKNVGTSPVSNTKEVDFQGMFCNHGCKDLNINGISLVGGDAADFDYEIIGGLPPNPIPNGTCFDIKIKFTPSETGSRSTTLEVRTDRGTFSGEIIGNGTGDAGIETVDAINFENVDCVNTERTTTIDVTNPGVLPLNVSSVAIEPDETDFEISQGLPGPTIAAGVTEQIEIKFKYDGNPGTKNATLRILSDASGMEDLQIPIQGVSDLESYSVDRQTIDLGTICVNEVGSESLELINDGSIQAEISASVGGGFTLPNGPSYSIGAGGSTSVPIEFSSSAEGEFEQTLTFESELCLKTTEVTLTVKVEDPKLEYLPASVALTSSGPPEEIPVLITNTSSRDLEISGVSFDPPDPNNQLTVLDAAPPFTIPAGGNKTIRVEFAPTVDEIINTTLKFEGTPCDFVDALDVEGNPNLAKATVEIGQDYSGYVGETIDIDVELKDVFKVAESGTREIYVKILYDQNVLECVSPVGQAPGEAEFTAPVAEPILQTLTFAVLDGLGFATMSTPLEIVTTDSRPTSGLVTFTEVDGFFEIKPSTASIGANSVSAAPGERISLQIYLRDVGGITDFHESVETQLRFNSTLLEPDKEFDANFTGTVNANREWVLTVKGMPIDPISSGDVIAEVPLRAMLGDAESTPIYVENSATKNGIAQFDESSAEFTLNSICRSGGTRLYDPFGAAGINVSPNPANSNITIEYEFDEQGYATIEIVDMLGSKVATAFSGEASIGTGSLEYDVSDFSAGSYFVVMKTPSRRIVERLYLSK